MNKLLLLLLLTTNVVAQEFLTSSSFGPKTAKGITVVEFWVEWNKGNEVVFLGSLKDCAPYRVCIIKSSDIQNEYKVTSVPTVIIFDNGVEQSRFIPNIMMELSATKKELQSVVDEITFNKFQ
tara:strand:- start:270 stop:638 length:369 start_codon:yes stop_codon:yes gene_type:complete